MTQARQTMENVLSESRRRSALALLAGAVVMGFVVQTKLIPFYWTPLIVGLTYLGAAVIGGRKGTLWAPGIVTTCWGIAVLLGVFKVVTIDNKLSYDIAAAIGVAIVLAFRRFTMTTAAGPVGVLVSVGVIQVQNYAHPPSWIFQGFTFAVLLGLWAVWELRPAAAPSTSSATADQRTDAEAAGRLAGASPASTTQ